MFGRIQSELGGVDVCINNAGLAHCAPLLSGSTADWKNMLDVNDIKPSNFFKAKKWEAISVYNSVFSRVQSRNDYTEYRLHQIVNM